MNEDVLQQEINGIRHTLTEDSKYFHLLKRLIPGFDKYEDLAIMMINVKGLRGALKFARKVKL